MFKNMILFGIFSCFSFCWAAEVSDFGGLSMPLKTWVARPLPPVGECPCPAGVGCKHYQPKFNFQNGRIYFFGGDINTHSADNPGGWGATYSYSILNDDWNLEYPACGPDGQLAPDSPTEAAFAYDSKRNLFYWTDGHTYGGVANAWCPNNPNRVQAPLAFDPITQKWSRPPFLDRKTFLGITGGAPIENANYDPITDALYEVSYGNCGVDMSILHLETNTWEDVCMATDDQGNNRNGGLNIENNYTDIDVEGRAIYWIASGVWEDPTNWPARLMRYNIDKRTVTTMADLPMKIDPKAQPTNVKWDAVNHILYWWPYFEEASLLYIYHPDPTGGSNGTWEKDSLFQPDGINVRGFHLAFDPQHNALMLMGGVNWHPEIDPNPSFYNYFFLYRYGNGVLDTIAPSVPTGLSASVNSPTKINLTWKASTDNQYVAGYHIYRDNNKIGAGSGASYSDTTVNNTQSYVYRVSAFDAKGNESAMSDPITSNTDIPVFTSPESISVSAGTQFGYKVNFYNSKSYITLDLDIRKKPSWTLLVGPDSIYGTAPAENRIDTLFAILKINNVAMDTLLVRIYVRSVSISRSLSMGKAVNELSIVSTSNANKGMNFTVGLPNAGEFDLQVFDIAGKKVWSVRDGITAAGYYRVSWNLNLAQKSGNGLYVVSLKQGKNEKRVKFTLIK